MDTVDCLVLKNIPMLEPIEQIKDRQVIPLSDWSVWFWYNNEAVESEYSVFLVISDFYRNSKFSHSFNSIRIIDPTDHLLQDPVDEEEEFKTLIGYSKNPDKTAAKDEMTAVWLEKYSRRSAASAYSLTPP